MFLKKVKRINQFELQMINIRNEELSSPYLGNKLEIVGELMIRYGKFEKAVAAGYSREAIDNAIEVLYQNGFKVDTKKRRIVSA